MHGFQPKKAHKWLERLKHISPHLSLCDIQQQKEDLAALLRRSSGEIRGDDESQMKMDHRANTKGWCTTAEATTVTTATENAPETQKYLRNPCEKVKDTNERDTVQPDPHIFSGVDESHCQTKEEEIDVQRIGRSEMLLLKAKVEDGNAKSMVELGELYLKGGYEQQAYHWFNQAAEKENALGTARKADCLLSGLGVPQNVEEGGRILLQAANEDGSGKQASILISCAIKQVTHRPLYVLFQPMRR